MLPPTLDALVSIQVRATDTAGNANVLTWEPAFAAVRDPRARPPVPPGTLALRGAQPNPVRSRAPLLAFALASTQPAKLALYDLAGREVASRTLPAPHAGSQVLALEPWHPLAAGLYFARLEQGGRSVSARVVVVR